MGRKMLAFFASLSVVTVAVLLILWLFRASLTDTAWTMTVVGVVLLAIACLAALFFYWRWKMEQPLHRLSRELEEILSGQRQALSLAIEETSLSQLHNQLERLVALLWQKEAQLVAEQKKSQEFVADISHQLKTPLAALRLYQEMGARGMPQPDKELALIEHMERLVASLLKMARLETGAYTMEFVEADLRKLAQEVADGLGLQFPSKHFSFQGPAQVPVRMDVGWMREALQNILKNACEHTAPAGNISLSFSQNQQSVQLLVADDGGGVEEAALSRLFERFYRSNAKTGSVGIGLPVARAVLEKHHGTISAKNGEKGLELLLVLPRIEGKLTIL